MIAKYVFMRPIVDENGEEESDFEEIKKVKMNSVSDFIKLLQEFMKDHPEAEFDEEYKELTIVERYKDGTALWLDIESERD